MIPPRPAPPLRRGFFLVYSSSNRGRAFIVRRAGDGGKMRRDERITDMLKMARELAGHEHRPRMIEASTRSFDPATVIDTAPPQWRTRSFSSKCSCPPRFSIAEITRSLSFFLGLTAAQTPEISACPICRVGAGSNLVWDSPYLVLNVGRSSCQVQEAGGKLGTFPSRGPITEGEYK